MSADRWGPGVIALLVVLNLVLMAIGAYQVSRRPVDAEAYRQAFLAGYNQGFGDAQRRMVEGVP